MSPRPWSDERFFGASSSGSASGSGFDSGAFSTSALTIRPPGPLPSIEERSMPCSSAIRRAIGDALTRPSSSLGFGLLFGLVVLGLVAFGLVRGLLIVGLRLGRLFVGRLFVGRLLVGRLVRRALVALLGGLFLRFGLVRVLFVFRLRRAAAFAD